MTKTSRFVTLVLALVAIVGSIVYLESTKPEPSTAPESTVVTVGSPYQELQNPTAFVNSEPFALGDYVGEKVILVDFWTYSCINCQRTQPYLNAWNEAYADEGLLIVGVHTPEFEFEKDLANVEAAVQEEGITYPVVLDNEKSTWNAYGNNYWPRKYLIGLDGTVVYDLIGEGSYAETEEAIRSALGLSTEPMSTVEDAISVEFDKVVSPETYFGTKRGHVEVVTIEPFSYNPGVGYLVGDWEQTGEYASNLDAKSTLLYHYNAKNVYMVAAPDPTALQTPLQVDVYLDGEFIKTIDITGYQLYPVIEGADYGSHLLKLVPKSPNLHVYTLTFG